MLLPSSTTIATSAINQPRGTLLRSCAAHIHLFIPVLEVAISPLVQLAPKSSLSPTCRREQNSIHSRVQVKYKRLFATRDQYLLNSVIRSSCAIVKPENSANVLHISCSFPMVPSQTRLRPIVAMVNVSYSR